jgi:hypothetical protein
MQSITLQTGDSAITAGDILGRINFAASSEGDGGAAILQTASIYAYAEGTFSASANPASIIIATSASDTSPAQARLKINQEGHLLPVANNTYDLGTTAYRFRHAYVNDLTINQEYSFPTSDGSANQVLQTDGNGSLSFATVSTGSAYTAGSGLTLAGTQFNVYGGGGNFEYLELQTDNTTIPKIKFTGSGVTDTPINLEVASSFESATGSGSALLFQGTQGQLFSITDNLSSGTIFSVSDITGLPMLEIDASGHVQIGEFADDITIHKPILLSGGIPTSTTNKLYNNAGDLYWDGNPLVELPTGGLESQILYKVSDASNELAWIDNYATELRELVKNDTGSDILKGTAVMATGAVGDRIQVAPATADGTTEARYMLGIASEDITNSTEGYITLVGPIKGLNTGSYTVGTVLWLDPDNDGELTSTQPSSPNLQMSVAIVTSSNASSGRIFVRMWEQQPGLHELHDVNVDVGLTSGDLIAYNSSNSTWENITNPSGYFESRVDAADAQIVAVSGYAEDYVDENLLQATGVSGIDITNVGSTAYFSAGSLSGYFESRVDTNETNIALKANSKSYIYGNSSSTYGKCWYKYYTNCYNCLCLNCCC